MFNVPCITSFSKLMNMVNLNTFFKNFSQYVALYPLLRATDSHTRNINSDEIK